MVKETGESFIERAKKLAEKRTDLVKAKPLQAERTRLKKEADRMLLVEEIAYHGLWQSEGQMQKNLVTYKTVNDKIKVLKVLFQFRKKILQQSPLPNSDKCLLLYSKGPRQKKKTANSG